MSKLNQFLIYDELPVWSAPFGLTLLDTIRLNHGMNILDIGSGSGFPMLEIAERAGLSCNIIGIDPSDDSFSMINRKIRLKKITNARIVQGLAEELPFDDGIFDLVVANNGLNNVADQEKSLLECFRVSGNGAQLVFTVNLPGTMIEFYEIFEQVLSELGMDKEIGAMKDHIVQKRKTVEYLKQLILKTGFTIQTINVDGFKMRYLDGSAFLNHYFIRTAFLPSWKKIIPGKSQKKVFTILEKKLNETAQKDGILTMSVPFVCFDCHKP